MKEESYLEAKSSKYFFVFSIHKSRKIKSSFFCSCRILTIFLFNKSNSFSAFFIDASESLSNTEKEHKEFMVTVVLYEKGQNAASRKTNIGARRIAAVNLSR